MKFDCDLTATLYSSVTHIPTVLIELIVSFIGDVDLFIRRQNNALLQNVQLEMLPKNETKREVKWENERFWICGWGVPGSLDPPKWSDLSGKKYREPMALPDLWEWRDEWEIDREDDNDDGWRYAFNFGFQFNRTRNGKSFVRRRRHVRTRQKVSYHGKAKMLLLGANFAGKSTLYKRFKMNAGKGLYWHASETSETVKAVHIRTVSNNVISAMKALIQLVTKLGERNVHPSNIVHKQTIESISWYDAMIITEDMKKCLYSLWNDDAIQHAFRKQAAGCIYQSTQYWFENLHRIAQESYQPTDQDILRSRIRTAGIAEHLCTFPDGSDDFLIVDVGGCRSERRKWVHCFDDVDVVIYCCEISAYDQVLFEDESSNRLTEALLLFDHLVNSKSLNNTTFILLFNKIDIFVEKIKEVPITVCPDFADYDGNLTDPQENLAYIKDRFLSKQQSTSPSVIPLVTSFVDDASSLAMINQVHQILIAHKNDQL